MCQNILQPSYIVISRHELLLDTKIVEIDQEIGNFQILNILEYNVPFFSFTSAAFIQVSKPRYYNQI